MKRLWAQPSLSRDFALLSAAIFFVLFLISLWVTYITYNRHSERIADELEKEAARIERTLGSEMERASYMLTALGKQIILDESRDFVKLAQVLKSFDSKHYIYSIFSWVSVDQFVVVSSNRGVLDKPVDISDRDYVKKSLTEPWKMQIGRPIEGRVSGRWVIPVAMGLTDYTGRFIGTIMISIDINTLTEQISTLVRRDGISFAIISKTLIPLTQVSDDKDFVTNSFPAQKLANVNFTTNPSGLITQGNLFFGTGSHSYYRVSADYPYIVLLGYDSDYSDETLRHMLWSRLLQLMAIAAFFILFLWIVRARLIRPVLDMTATASAVAQGEDFSPLPKGGPQEIEGLSLQVQRISEYIKETKRIEEELRNKMFMLKNAKEQAEIDQRSKTEFLAYICQEIRNPLTNVIGFAQVMKDQLYGPIENRKYRQYASDIYRTGNTLLSNVEDLLTLSKAETSYFMLTERPVNIADVINKVMHFIAEKMQSENLRIQIKLQDPLPRLIGDEFRMQQTIMNLLLYAMQHQQPENELQLEIKVVSENKDKLFLAIIISTEEKPPYTPEHLGTLAERTMYSAPSTFRPTDPMNEPVDLSLELAKMLISLHHGALHINREGNALTMVVFFSSGRLRPYFGDEEK